jgi:peptide chain release factor 1
MNIEKYENRYKENPYLEKQHDLEQRMINAHNTGEDMSTLSEELTFYSTLATKVNQIQKVIQEYKDAQALLSDEEMKDLAKSEIEKDEELIEKLDREITEVKIDREFSDEDDMKSAILEIRAGAGGDEAALFAADLFRMYKNYSLNQGWRVNIIDYNLTEGGGYKEVVAKIDGKGVYKALKYESGVHRVQRVPVTESSGRIHTSTASVAILPEAKNVDIEIKQEDLEIEVMRASGAGGQCVNRTDSAVRITHKPTGIVVSCQETKHQAQNKEKAMQILRARLYERKKSEMSEKRSDLRSSQIGSAMRAEKIRTYNFPQNRITDHRIKKSWHNLEDILNGNIQELIDQTKKGVQLKALEEAKDD